MDVVAMVVMNDRVQQKHALVFLAALGFTVDRLYPMEYRIRTLQLPHTVSAFESQLLQAADSVAAMLTVMNQGGTTTILCTGFTIHRL